MNRKNDITSERRPRQRRSLMELVELGFFALSLVMALLLAYRLTIGAP